jgi:protein-S-isoprenylcysteine O-methyltransferase Ste14
MPALELKIPPVILTLLFAAMMWLASRLISDFPPPGSFRLAALIVFATAGAIVGLASVVSFRKASTTVNPLKPETCSALVTNGIFNRTRNPMYLALLLFLIGWGIYLGSALSLALTILYVMYLNRFQIEPEERALTAAFGQEFLDYKQQVRRWI